MTTTPNIKSGNYWINTNLTYSFDKNFMVGSGVKQIQIKADNDFAPHIDLSTLDKGDVARGTEAAVLWSYFSKFTLTPLDTRLNPADADIAILTGFPTRPILGAVASAPAITGRAKDPGTGNLIGAAAVIRPGGEMHLPHELGHALGLMHHNYNDPENKAWNTDMTVMSYNPGGGILGIGANRAAVTPMAYDIAALEEMHGKKEVATGDNTYGTGYPITYSNGASGSIAFTAQHFTGIKQSSTIKDDGGTDSFDLSKYNGAAGVTIDLRQAIDKNGVWQDKATVVGDEYIYIARGTVIENATGTAKGDLINGNDSANKLDGGKGTNILTGGAGNDVFVLNNGGVSIITDPEAGDRLAMNNVGADGKANDSAISGVASKAGSSWALKGADGTDYTLTQTGTDLTIANAKAEIIAVAKNFKSGDLGITLSEQVATPPISFAALPTAVEMTNVYLFGQKTAPTRFELVSDKWIRDKDATTSINVDSSAFMQNGPGRFAVGGQFPVVKAFFAAANDNYLDKAAKFAMIS